MRAEAASVLALFEKKMRLEVPLFQRQYVWNQESHWEPLWEDIQRKFTEYLEGRKDSPVHFLGAMVLDQKQTPATHVEKRQVIDGQQRLTTLQIFLAVLRDFARENGCEDLAKEFDAYTANRGMMANPEVDKFKVWPTRLDQAQFMDVVSAGSKTALETRHPLVRRKYARAPEPRPRMVEAYLFFDAEIREFFLPANPPSDLPPLSIRVEEALQALRSALRVVVIDLETTDDAQVIFETLNARGEPLLPADLLRNYIFLRASRGGESQEQLYAKHWQQFDDEFWRKEMRQGRLLRPRSDLFLQHYLTSQKLEDIPVKHLYVEYRHWIESGRPFKSVEEELATLARYGTHFRRLTEHSPDDSIGRLAAFLETFDVSTAFPLLLALMDAGLTNKEWEEVTEILESYIVRRAVCGWTTKNYNRTFLSVARALRKAGKLSPEQLRHQLASAEGQSVAWPTDSEFATAWVAQQVYQTMTPPRLVHILRRISDATKRRGAEEITISSPLTIEHLMPQDWVSNWPLPNGDKGLRRYELVTVEDDDPRAVATLKRNDVVHTIGNLTIVTTALNASVSNGSWTQKRPELEAVSLLPINRELAGYDEWSERTIKQRAESLFQKARALWRGPQ